MDYHLIDEKNEHRNSTSSYDNDALLSGIEMDVSGGGQRPSQQPLPQELRDQYTEELRQVEEEIKTLRHVLTARYSRQHFLRRQLGITTISELREDLKHGMENLRSSDAYRRTSEVMQTAKDKTSATIQEKWSFFKNTPVFKTLEDKVGTAYTSVRGKMIGVFPNSAGASTSAAQDVELTDHLKTDGDAGEVQIGKSASGGDTTNVPTAPPDPLDEPADDAEELNFVNSKAELSFDTRETGSDGQTRRKKQSNSKRLSTTGAS